MCIYALTDLLSVGDYQVLQMPLLISMRRPAQENCEFSTLPLHCADALKGYVRKDLCKPPHKSDV